MSNIKLVLVFIVFAVNATGQGYNHQWLLGNYYFLQDPKGRMFIDNNSITLQTEFRKMPFLGTQANISDANGNLLMASNGIWIANATGDTMLNGGGLNPGAYASSWAFGMPLTGNNIFLPHPDISNLYYLFHHSMYFDGFSYLANEVFLSKIDISLDFGSGAVIQKNELILTDTINQGFGASRHANGKDWWIVCQKNGTDKLIKILLSGNGIDTITYQSLSITSANYNVTQLSFSNDGNKFSFYYYDITNQDEFLVICNFDRCSGEFSNIDTIQLTYGQFLWGLAFSPSGKYVYACTSSRIFQIDTDNLNVDTVAVYDGFISPPGDPCCATSFWNMYLAANGKIYVTSGSSVQHLTVINYPDSAGLACDVQQHSIDLIDYLHLRSVPNHPNYYLGCDTTLGCPCLTTGIEEHISHDFRFNVAPNPTSGSFKITYLLP
ncbi:MAG: hypothetical protein JNL49_14805, partial [Bacteroidia bacterium]|nr:hypothetical protein [Bacteroidia bacterium]